MLYLDLRWSNPEFRQYPPNESELWRPRLVYDGTYGKCLGNDGACKRTAHIGVVSGEAGVPRSLVYKVDLGGPTRMVTLCLDHFNTFMAFLGGEAKSGDQISGCPYITVPKKCFFAAKVNDLHEKQKSHTLTSCSGNCTFVPAGTDFPTLRGGFVCDSHIKCMQCGLRLQGGDRVMKAYIDLNPRQKKLGMVCSDCLFWRRSLQFAGGALALFAVDHEVDCFVSSGNLTGLEGQLIQVVASQSLGMLVKDPSLKACVAVVNFLASHQEKVHDEVKNAISLFTSHHQ